MNTVGGNEARFCIKWISGVPKHSWETCAKKDEGAQGCSLQLIQPV